MASIFTRFTWTKRLRGCILQPNNQFTDVEALQKALYEQRRENEKLEKINAALMYRMEEGGFNHHSYRAFEQSVGLWTFWTALSQRASLQGLANKKKKVPTRVKNLNPVRT